MPVFSRPSPFTPPEVPFPEAFTWLAIIVLIVTGTGLFFITLTRKRRRINSDLNFGLTLMILLTSCLTLLFGWAIFFASARESDEHQQQVQQALNTWLETEHPETADRLTDEQVMELWEEETLATDSTTYLLQRDEDLSYHLYESAR